LKIETLGSRGIWQQPLDINCSQNTVQGHLRDWESRKVTLLDCSQNLFHMGGYIEPDDAGSWPHNLVDPTISQPKDALQHFSLGVLEGSGVHCLVDQSLYLFFRDLGFRRMARRYKSSTNSVDQLKSLTRGLLM
jgi:hypothetical protein